MPAAHVSYGVMDRRTRRIHFLVGRTFYSLLARADEVIE
jgi:hypothetical protein